MENFTDQQFTGERILLDGKSFTRCRFISCVFAFEGTEVFGLTDCSISNDTVFGLEGAAKLTMQRFHAMLHSQGWMANVATNILELLKQPPGAEAPPSGSTAGNGGARN